jgi:putative ABC transport system permease protein
MLKKYLSLLIRESRKHRTASLINILGLTLAITSSIFIIYFINDELKYDQHYPNKDRIVRFVTQDKKTGEKNAIQPGIWMPKILAVTPEIEKGFRLINNGRETFVLNNTSYTGNLFYADNEITDVLSLPFIKGDNENALKEPFSIILTEDIARKFFGNVNPVGSTLTIKDGNDYKITGVIKNIPIHSHIRPEIIASSSTLNTIRPRELNDDTMSNSYFYFLLKKEKEVSFTENNMNKYFEKILPEFAKTIKFVLEPINKIYLYSTETRWDIASHGDIDMVENYLLIAVVIMLMAAFNFSNLLAAFIKMREKGTAIRLLLGAKRKSLLSYLVFEIFFYILISIAASVLLIGALKSGFNTISGKEFTYSVLFEGNLPRYILLSILFIAFSSIIYPAYILSKADMLERIKGKIHSSGIRALGINLRFRHVVTCFQYVITIVMIITTIIIYRQLEYSKNAHLGFNKEQLLEIKGVYDKKMYDRYNNYKNSILKYPEIISVSASGNTPGENINNYTNAWVSSKSEKEKVHCAQIAIDYDLFKTWGTKVTRGRDFSRNMITDSNAVIVNEKAVEKLGLKEPIGARLNGINNAYNNQVVIGVVENIHFQSSKEEIYPIIFYLREWSASKYLVRVNTSDIASTLNMLKTEWNEIEPDRPFECSFMDQKISDLYKAEGKTENIVVIFTLMAIIVASIGLLGLLSHLLQSRTKEIGVRKVLGASTTRIVSMISKEYLLIILSANIIAIPVAYFIMDNWLQKYVYKEDITIWVLAAGGAIALIIAMVLIIYKTTKAALANPVESLRYE